MINGKTLKNAYIAAAISIHNQKRQVDELNVYPVPDGDTGTNMAMTMGNALNELRSLPDDVSASHAADVCASAMLRGARGNSGVISSLIFRGMAKGFADKDEIGCDDIVRALSFSTESAYKAVMKPVEGTILTVVRVASEKAAEFADKTDDPVALWSEVCSAAEDALASTTELLPVLKKAKVVDAGGKGLTVLWNAMLDIFKGGAVPESAKPSERKHLNFDTTVGDADDENITFTYCTEFIINRNSQSPDPSRLRAFLGTIGDCVLVVDDGDIIKVHVHTDHPGKAIEEGLTYGMLDNLKIDNLRKQHENKSREAQISREKNVVPAEPEKPFGFACVATGAGLEELFMSIGADCIIKGGQTMNPSTDDIIRAVYSVPAETVFVLPNNKNIIMAAEQAAKLSAKKICVIPSRTIPQGMTAMLNYDPDAALEDNRLNMTRSLEHVATGLVTFAARDSDMDGHNIRKGEILGLENGRLTVTEKDLNKAAYKLAKKMIKNTTGFVTVICGEDVSEETSAELEELFRNKFSSDIDISFINGGQPVYYYMISVE